MTYHKLIPILFNIIILALIIDNNIYVLKLCLKEYTYQIPTKNINTTVKYYFYSLLSVYRVYLIFNLY